MLSAIMGLLSIGAAAVLVVSGALVRRAMERDGLLQGAGLMPAGAKQEGV